MAAYEYTLAVPTTLAVPDPLPPVRNEIQRASVDLRYALDAQVAVEFEYAYERFDVEDFARSAGTLESPLLPSFLNLAAWYGPYRVHTGIVRLVYLW